MAVPERRTKDGFELQIGTNHLGHFALTNLLLPHVTDRVVTVASGAHRMGKIRLDDLNWEQRRLRALARLRPVQARQPPLHARAPAPAGRGGLRRARAGRPPRLRRDEPPEPHGEPRCRTRSWRSATGCIAQSDEMGALPTLFAATQDLPGASYVGPDGFAEQRGHPTLVGRSARGERRGDREAAVGRSPSGSPAWPSRSRRAAPRRSRRPPTSLSAMADAPRTISFARGAPSLDIVDVEGLKEAAAAAFDAGPRRGHGLRDGGRLRAAARVDRRPPRRRPRAGPGHERLDAGRRLPLRDARRRRGRRRRREADLRPHAAEPPLARRPRPRRQLEADGIDVDELEALLADGHRPSSRTSSRTSRTRPATR